MFVCSEALDDFNQNQWKEAGNKAIKHFSFGLIPCCPMDEHSLIPDLSQLYMRMK